jgi:predicted RNase H-like nuclease (RuvC/YqgF family)
MIKNSVKIMKLKQMNEKLAKELKTLGSTLEKSIEKSKAKPKQANPTADANIQAKEKELETAQRQVKSYQKEIAGLKAKLEAKTGYEKYAS